MKASSSSPSSWRWWRGEWQIACPAASSPTSAQRWWRTSTGAQVVIVPSGRQHGPVATNRRHTIEAPAHTNGEATHWPSAPLLEQHSETAVVVRLVVEIGVVGLGAAFDGSLLGER